MSDYLDDLLAKQGKTGGGDQPQAGGDVDHLDELLAAQSNSSQPGTPKPPSAPKQGFWAGLGDAVYDGAMGVADRMSKVPEATAKSGWVGNAVDLAKAAYHNVGVPLVGIDQKGQALGAGLIHAVAPGSRADKNASAQLAAQGKANDNWEAAYQADVPDSLGAMTGATVGQIAPWLLKEANAGLNTAGAATKKLIGAPTRALAKAVAPVPYVAPAARAVAKTVDVVADAAGKGAVIAQTMPVAGGVSPATVGEGAAKELVIGGALGMAGKGVGAAASVTNKQVLRPIARVVNPSRIVGENLPKIAGVNPADYVTALRAPGAAELVPGSYPTVAQGGAQGLGSSNAGVVQLEKWMRSNVPGFLTKFDQRSNSNGDARLGALSQVAGTDEGYQAARGLRAEATGPMYTTAFETPVVGDEALGNIMGTDVFPQALERAQRIANNEMPPRRVVINHGTPEVSTPSPILDQNGDPMLTRTEPSGPAQYSVEGLHDTLGALREMPGDMNLGITGKNNRNITGVGNALDSWLTDASPAFGAAQRKYAELSRPINNMDAGRAIQQEFEGATAGAGGNPQLRLQKFNNAVHKATNPERVPYPPDAETMTALHAIRDDLQRATVSNAGGPPGSSTALNLKSDDWFSRMMNPHPDGEASGVAQSVIGGGAAMLGGPSSAVAALYGLGKGSKFLNDRLLAAYEDALMNPARAAELIERYNPSGSTGPLSAVPAGWGTTEGDTMQVDPAAAR